MITEPMPSMPVGFWNDPGGERLRESYFDMYPGVWRHGDWIRITPDGSAVIYGRSDSTINRGGVRMGTSEIYRAVLALPEIADALVVDVPREGAESWMPLFVVLGDGASLDADLIAADRAPRARGLLAAPRPERGDRGRRGPAHAVRQGARGARQADPDGRGPGARREPRLAAEPGGARRRSWISLRSAPAPRERSRWRTSPRTLARLICGLWLFGTGEGLVVASELGNSPWTVLAEGVSLNTPLSVGAATIAISAAVLLAWVPLRQRPGLGTVLNAVARRRRDRRHAGDRRSTATRWSRAGCCCSAASGSSRSAAASTSAPRSGPARATA